MYEIFQNSFARKKKILKRNRMSPYHHRSRYFRCKKKKLQKENLHALHTQFSIC